MLRARIRFVAWLTALVLLLGTSSAAWADTVSYSQQGARLATARIRHWFSGYGQVPLCCGTGTLVGVDGTRGLVLTVAHLFEDGKGPITVEFADGQVSGATLLARDVQLDVAALWIYAPHGIRPLPISKAEPTLGEQLEIWGYGPERFRSFLAVAARPLLDEGEDAHEFLSAQGVEDHMVTIPGDSGGPVVYSGQLVGVHWGYRGTLDDPRRAVHAAPSQLIRTWLTGRFDEKLHARLFGY